METRRPNNVKIYQVGPRLLLLALSMYIQGVLVLTLCTRKTQTTARQTIFGPMAAQYGVRVDNNQWRQFRGDGFVLGGSERIWPRKVSLRYNGKRRLRVRRWRWGSGNVGARGSRCYCHGRDWCLAAPCVHCTVRSYRVVSYRYAGACDDKRQEQRSADVVDTTNVRTNERTNKPIWRQR